MPPDRILQDAFAQDADALLLVDVATETVLAANQMAGALLHTSATDLVGRTLAELLSPDTPPGTSTRLLSLPPQAYAPPALTFTLRDGSRERRLREVAPHLFQSQQGPCCRLMLRDPADIRLRGRLVREVMEASGAVIWTAHVTLTNNQLTLQYDSIVNQEAFPWLPECPPAEWRARWNALMSPHALAENNQLLRRALQNAHPYFETRSTLTGRDGSTRWIQERIAVRRSHDHEFRLCAVATDITHIVGADQRLRDLVSRAHCLLWTADVHDVEGRRLWTISAISAPSFSHWSGPIASRFQSNQHENRQDNGWGFHVDPAIRAEMNARSDHAFTTNAPGYEQIFPAQGLDGSRRWLREQVDVTSIGPGHWQCVGVIVDATELHTTATQLAEEKEFLATTLEGLSDAVVSLDDTGLIRYANPAAIALRHTRTPDLLTHPFATAFAWQQDDAPVAAEELLILGRANPCPALHLRTHDGRLIPVALRVTPLRTHNQSTPGLVLVWRDITLEQQHEQDQLRTSKLESVALLAGGIAHDFNNILTALLGNISLARLDLVDHHPAIEPLNAAQAATFRARDLTQQLLTFAKGGTPIRQQVQLGELLREVTEFSLTGTTTRPHFDLSTSLWPAEIDSGQIGQVIQNLVINAAQAMAAGGIVTIRARNFHGRPTPALPVDDYLQIDVADQGAGITAEHLAKIFDPYFTTKPAGHGLGLAVVHSIIRSHHGHISVESAPGAGTCFSFWLPALKTDSAHPAAPAATAPLSSRPHILFFDDDIAIQNFVRTIFQRQNIPFTVAATAHEALTLWQTARDQARPFDLVITDLTIPGGPGGLELLGWLRARDPQIRAIVSSGYATAPVMANYQAHGFCGMLPKPYLADQLLHAIATALAATPPPR